MSAVGVAGVRSFGHGRLSSQRVVAGADTGAFAEGRVNNMSETVQQTMERVTQFVNVALTRLISEGWEPPILMAMISANSGLLFGRYAVADDTGLAFETLAENFGPAGVFVPPINIILINPQTGDAARALLAEGDTAPRMVH